MAKIKATGLRAGMLIGHEGRLWRLLKCEHVHVGGRGGAYMQVEMRGVEDGTKTGHRFKTDEMLERPHVETRRMTYLYGDGDQHVFMDGESFEQTVLDTGFLDTQADFLVTDMEVGVSFHDDRPIGVEMPPSAVYEVADTEPNIKGSTVSGSYKPATLQTGMTVMVPQFVGKGERIRVSTDTGEYLERAD